MNLEEKLLSGNSSKIWDTIADHVIAHPEDMKELMRLYFHPEYHRYNRATQTVGHLWGKEPRLIHPYLIEMAKYLDTNPPMANKRSIMRLYQWADIDPEVEGILFDHAIRFLKSAEEPLAVKAYSMTVARRICELYPELAQELIPLLEIIIDEKLSSGTVNRARQELRRLQKLL